jgi:predicted PurR-regulated permease PerM
MESPHPTLWQRKILWGALTFLAIALIGALTCGLLYLVTRVLAYFQPLLIPIAVAGVLAYLLEPVIRWMEKYKIPRLRAVILVFVAVTGIVIGILTWIIPTLYTQSTKFAAKLPAYTEIVRDRIAGLAKKYAPNIKISPIFETRKEPTEPTVSGTAAPEEGEPESETEAIAEASPDDSPESASAEPQPYFALESVVESLKEQLPDLTTKAWNFLRSSVGGFLGAFGFLVSLLIVPVYLFFFLNDAPLISRTWSNYLPLRASAFKDEVVATVSEINGYLINFFRGQLVVSLIDGALTGLALLVIGLDFAILIGLMVAVLGLVPYIGIILCWIPAVLIAVVQWPGEWFHPLLVTGIFIAVQNIDGIFIAPKIVGESVGLHPLTVIMSVLAWSFLLGGLLGAILAVPLTATLKVLLKRFVWDRQRLSHTGNVLTAESGSPAPNASKS